MLLAACAAHPRSVGGEDALSREVAGRVAGSSRPCLSAGAATSGRIVDAATIAYGSGRTIWIGRLRAECPGLRPGATMIVESHGGETCRGDRISALEPNGLVPGPLCFLGGFVPFTRP